MGWPSPCRFSKRLVMQGKYQRWSLKPRCLSFSAALRREGRFRRGNAKMCVGTGGQKPESRSQEPKNYFKTGPTTTRTPISASKGSGRLRVRKETRAQSSSQFPLCLCSITLTTPGRSSHAPVGATPKSPICRMVAGCDARCRGDRG
jgi:hypothetical protein